MMMMMAIHLPHSLYTLLLLLLINHHQSQAVDLSLKKMVNKGVMTYLGSYPDALYDHKRCYDYYDRWHDRYGFGSLGVYGARFPPLTWDPNPNPNPNVLKKGECDWLEEEVLKGNSPFGLPVGNANLYAIPSLCIADHMTSCRNEINYDELWGIGLSA